jgi:hypothetical protein
MRPLSGIDSSGSWSWLNNTAVIDTALEFVVIQREEKFACHGRLRLGGGLKSKTCPLLIQQLQPPLLEVDLRQ